MYYAVTNQYSNELSFGFYNTYNVWVFASKKERDDFVDGDPALATKSIPRSAVTHYISNLQDRIPFSSSYVGVIYSKWYLETINAPEGAVGTVELIDHDHEAQYFGGRVERFHK
jgi:hypothetical protein